MVFVEATLSFLGPAGVYLGVILACCCVLLLAQCACCGGGGGASLPAPALLSHLSRQEARAAATAEDRASAWVGAFCSLFFFFSFLFPSLAP